jgi:hypothetical protein
MCFWKRKQDKISGERKRRRWLALAYWPDEVAGWLRIPSMIAAIAGILGVVKYSSLSVSVYLKPVNLPPVEFCWLMLGIGCTVYVLSLACWLFVEDVAKTCGPRNHSVSDNSSQWRSM